MPERITYYVTPDDDGWRVVREGAQRADSIHADKVDAIERARELGRAQTLGQVVIQGRDGRFQTEWTYGQDPRRTPG
jgi:Uncharacterized protein conserved in bacteria (DUF2188)